MLRKQQKLFIPCWVAYRICDKYVVFPYARSMQMRPYDHTMCTQDVQGMSPRQVENKVISGVDVEKKELGVVFQRIPPGNPAVRGGSNDANPLDWT
ncbi:hypothetical protein NC651_020957 [Populus alba x Populus x berolinensis]|nr:hypothetical protein NC651_020957 [Populus alba x Populus x berolinensis]